MELPALSKSELDILKILWSRKRMSAREVHESLGDGYDWSYSTTRTILGRMVDKGIVRRKRFHGILLYAPTITRPQGLARLVADFARRVLEVEPGAVVPLFAQGSTLTPEEVEELTAILEGAAAAPGGEGA